MTYAGGGEGFKSILHFPWIWRYGALLQRQAERAGVVQPGDEKVLGRLWPSSTLRELMERRERDFLHRHIVTAQGTMVLN